MAKIGIIQGRLLPPAGNRFQSFPAHAWREEFKLAKDAGLDCIEWIFEKPNDIANPLSDDDGIKEMLKLSDEYKIGVWSICADYYMTEPLISATGKLNEYNVRHLHWLIGRAGILGARYIVLPFVDNSSLAGHRSLNALTDLFDELLPAARRKNLEIHLETDIEPHHLSKILEQSSDPNLKINYDIGNSASLGYEPNEELNLLGNWLGSVHIKDRKLHGGTVPLGSGNADLRTSIRLIEELNFDRWFVLQAARGIEGEEVNLAIQNRKFIENLIG